MLIFHPRRRNRRRPTMLTERGHGFAALLFALALLFVLCKLVKEAG